MLSGVEAGSLDRGKAALERRNKKSGGVTGGSVIDDSCAKVTGRVEVTRVNPDSLIDQLLKASNLDDQSAEEDGKHSKPETHTPLPSCTPDMAASGERPEGKKKS